MSKSQPNNPTSGTDAATACDATSQSCPDNRSITGRFAITEVKCGSNVELQAEATNIPEGTNTTFTLKQLPAHSNIQILVAPLSGLQVRGLNWISKKPSDQWPEWEVDFDVSADGTSAHSENQLKFHRYPNYAREAKTIARTNTSGDHLRDGKFDIEYLGDGVKVIIKIKLVNLQGTKPADGDPMPATGDPVSGEDKANMRQDIESKLTEKLVLHRHECQRGGLCDCALDRKCCKFKVRIQVDFVESGEHHEVNLFQGSGRADSVNWTRIKTRDNSWAHETGHLLGWFDEYSGTTNPGPTPRWQVPREGVIMNTGLEVPAEYYWDFRDWFAAKTGETWDEVVP